MTTVQGIKELLEKHGGKLLKDTAYHAPDDPTNVPDTFHADLPGRPGLRFLTLEEIPAWIAANNVPKVEKTKAQKEAAKEKREAAKEAKEAKDEAEAKAAEPPPAEDKPTHFWNR